MSHRPLSLSDFKNWFSEQQGMSDFFEISNAEDKYVGNRVRPKVSEEKMLERIETDDDADQLIQEFIEEGGVVTGVEGKQIYIETSSGEFSLPRFCVKIRRPKD